MSRLGCFRVWIVPLLLTCVGFCNEARAGASDSALRGLVEALRGDDAVARFLAEEKLAAAGNRALPALERLAASPGYSPGRRYAINIIARVGSPEAIRLLLRMLEREPDVMARAWVCRHLGRMGVQEAVPIIGKWLLTIQGKSISVGGGDRYGNPRVVTRSYAWVLHVHALREIGSEEAIPILERMFRKKHGGKAGRALMRAYRDALAELRKEAEFWRAVRRVPGLEPQVKVLFDFFRRDTVALIRLYRDKIIRSGVEGRWVLESLKKHPDAPLRQAAMVLLREYDKLGHRP